MRNWDVGEICMRMNLPFLIWLVWVPIWSETVLIQGRHNRIYGVVSRIAHVHLYSAHRSHFHSASYSFLSTTLPSLQNKIFRYPSLYLHALIMWSHQVQHTLCTAYTVYSIHRAQHTLCTAYTVYRINWVQYTLNTAYTKYSIQWVEHTPSTAYTMYSIHQVHLTPRTEYPEYSVPRVQHTPSTAYPEYSIPRVQHTPSTAYSEYSIHWVQHTLSTAYILFTINPKMFVLPSFS